MDVRLTEDAHAIPQPLINAQLEQLTRTIAGLGQERENFTSFQDLIDLINDQDMEERRDSTTVFQDVINGIGLENEQDLHSLPPSTHLRIKSNTTSTATQYVRGMPRVSLEELHSDHRGCDICMTDYHTGEGSEDPVRLPCGHVFGDACLAKWLSSLTAAENRTCPVCRVVLSDFHEYKSLLQLLRADQRNRAAQEELDVTRRFFLSPESARTEMARLRRRAAEADIEKVVRGSDTPSLETLLRVFANLSLNPQSYTFEEASLLSRRMGEAKARLRVVIHEPDNKDDLLIFSNAPRITLNRRTQMVSWGPEGPGAVRILSSNDWRLKIVGTLAILVGIEAAERHRNGVRPAAR